MAIRDVAKVVGTMVAYLPGVENGILHYRNLENQKKVALPKAKGNCDAITVLNHNSIDDILWWEGNVKSQFSNLIRQPPSMYLNTDSSLRMWGATTGSTSTGGNWNSLEALEHINVLEMKAFLFGLQALCSFIQNSHIRIRTDSSTSVCYVNARGGCKSWKMNALAKEMWTRALDNNSLLSAEHIKGKDNIEADSLSRNQDNSSEWSLDSEVFINIISFFKFFPTIDLFASRINNKLERFVSWQPDPSAVFTDAFVKSFNGEYFYASLPISLVTRFLKEVEFEELEGIIIVTCWSTQSFFSIFLKLIIIFLC